MINKVPYLISAIIIGLIIYQSGFIAPSINKIIDKDNASIYLRFIWPKFFLIIAFLSITFVMSRMDAIPASAIS